MTVQVEGEIIAALWKALKQPSPTRRPQGNVGDWLRQIASKGWADAPDIEDLPQAMDRRVDLLHNVDHKKLAAAFDLPLQVVYPRPNNSNDEVWGSRCLSAANFAYLLIMLERLGFRTDATVIADVLRPVLNAKSHVTEQELAVLCYSSWRHKMAPLALQNSVIGDWKGLKSEYLVTEAGYRAELQSDDDGTPLWLTVKPPRRRRNTSANAATVSEFAYDLTPVSHPAITRVRG